MVRYRKNTTKRTNQRGIMSDAYCCDECNEYNDGEPAISMAVSVEGSNQGMLSQLFSSGPKLRFDFCCLQCAELWEANQARDELLHEIDKKHELLDNGVEEHGQ